MAGEPLKGAYTNDDGVNPLYHRGLPAYKVMPPPNPHLDRRELVTRTFLITVTVLFTICLAITLGLAMTVLMTLLLA